MPNGYEAYTEPEQCPTTRGTYPVRDHPSHSYIRGRKLYRCRGRGVGSEPATTSSPDKGDVPEGQPAMPFAKDNATRYSFDFTAGAVDQLDVTKSAALGKYGGASTDVNIELRLDSSHAVSLKLTQAQFDLFMRAAHPATQDMTLKGHCLNCYKPAVANLDGTWVHVGVSCGPGEGQFVLGEAERPQTAPEAPSPATSPLDDVKGMVRDLLTKIRPYKMFLPQDVQKAYEKADVWAKVTDDAMSSRG